MLNELASIRQGLATAGIEVERGHPQVQPVGKARTPVLVRLEADGSLQRIDLLPEDVTGSLWTFRDGKHNSFPFMSPPPLLDLASSERDAFNKRWKEAALTDRRKALYQAAGGYPNGGLWRDGWPGKGLMDSVRSKRAALGGIEAEAAAVPEVVDRFLAIFSVDGGDRQRRRFVNALVAAFLREVESGIDDWLEPARAALIGEVRKKKVVGGDFYFDVASGQFDRDVHHPRNRAAAARALSGANKTDFGRCAISGESTELHRGNFPQPNFPALGLSYLFSKNDDLPATGSYGRFGHDAFPVGRLIVGDLEGAIRALVIDSRENVTWSKVPGERGKTTDLLIAFVDGAPDTPAVRLLAGDAGDDPDDEDDGPDPVANYERRTQRLLDAVKGKTEGDFRKTPVQVCLLRKVDEGNRKALLHRHLTVGQLYECAQKWTRAQRNLPPWLFRRHNKQRQRPQALTPLSIPGLTRRQFVRGGTEATDAIGLPATEAFALFLQEGDTTRLARRFLHVVLKRHRQLLEATAHAKHGARDTKLDRATALRVLTLVAILLNALGRRGGSWMNEAAFRLGQLLSVADVLHAGYCADVRHGQVPPALLGNAVLTMAQANPAKALAALARRWKPYASWAKRASAAQAAKLRGSDKPEERDRGWRVSQAIWHYRRAAEISGALHGQLPQTADDVFRAELLLGYISGLPPTTKAETHDDQTGEESDGDV